MNNNKRSDNRKKTIPRETLFIYTQEIETPKKNRKSSQNRNVQTRLQTQGINAKH